MVTENAYGRCSASQRAPTAPTRRSKASPTTTGRPWYAAFIVARWREEPGGGTHELLLDDEEQQLLIAAVHSYLDDFGHDEADVLRRLKDLHAKLQAA